MENQFDDSVLLATVRAKVYPARGLVVVESGREAAAAWRESRHRVVLADFGALSDNMTGTRLARSIRSQCSKTHICLLSDGPRADQIKWALAQGADELVPRTREEIMKRLPAGMPAPAIPWLNSDFPSLVDADEVIEKVMQDVTQALNEAGLGPAASLVVEDAMKELLERFPDSPPQPGDLAAAVGMEITDIECRRRFLREFGVR